jgi:hypothetical protein
MTSFKSWPSQRACRKLDRPFAVRGGRCVYRRPCVARQELPAHMTGADRRARASGKRLAERSHDAETETAAAVIEDLLYLIPAHSRRSDKLRRRKRLGRGRGERDNNCDNSTAPSVAPRPRRCGRAWAQVAKAVGCPWPLMRRTARCSVKTGSEAWHDGLKLQRT